MEAQAMNSQMMVVLETSCLTLSVLSSSQSLLNLQVGFFLGAGGVFSSESTSKADLVKH